MGRGQGLSLTTRHIHRYLGPPPPLPRFFFLPLFHSSLLSLSLPSPAFLPFLHQFTTSLLHYFTTSPIHHFTTSLLHFTHFYFFTSSLLLLSSFFAFLPSSLFSTAYLFTYCFTSSPLPFFRSLSLSPFFSPFLPFFIPPLPS
jgi:hypothetical protein